MRILSQTAAKLQGSVGGITFQGGPAHSLQARARVSRYRLKTGKPAQVFSSYRAFQTAWRRLSTTQRANWQRWASVNLPGKQKYRPLSIGRKAAFHAWYQRHLDSAITGAILPAALIAPQISVMPMVVHWNPPGFVIGSTSIRISVFNPLPSTARLIARRSGPHSAVADRRRRAWSISSAQVGITLAGAQHDFTFTGLRRNSNYWFDVLPYSTTSGTLFGISSPILLKTNV